MSHFIRMLVDSGARLDQTNTRGSSALDVVMRNEGSNFRNPTAICAQLHGMLLIQLEKNITRVA